MYTVATQLPSGERRNGRNYPTLSRAERKAWERAASLPSDAKALLIGNSMKVEMEFPGQLPAASAQKSKRTRRK
jgi:hypothetical protein